MGMIKEFKEFAMRGNVVDLAVGIIIGGAFGKIVTALVNDVIMPPLGLVIGGKGFKDIIIWLGEGDKPASLELAQKSGQPFIGIGSFMQTTLDFLIVAFAIFLMVKLMNKAQSYAMLKEAKKEAAAPPPPPEDIQLLREIRDALRKN